MFFILSVLTGCVKDNQGTSPSQHGFMKSRSWLTNLISSYDQVTSLVDEGKAVDFICLDFSKPFDTISLQHCPGETNRLPREVVESPSLEVFKKMCRYGT